MATGIYLKEGSKIYRYRDKHDDYILCTPWKQGEDRRKLKSEFNNPIYHINRNKALEEINKQWRECTFSWTYDGKKYETRGQAYEEKIKMHNDKYNWDWTDYKGVFSISPEHKWHHTSDYNTADGRHIHREYDDTYYLMMYHGKLIWTCISQYIPQVYYYKFEGIDIEPKEWGGWTNIKCIRPVYCVTDKKFI